MHGHEEVLVEGKLDGAEEELHEHPSKYVLGLHLLVLLVDLLCRVALGEQRAVYLALQESPYRPQDIAQM